MSIWSRSHKDLARLAKDLQDRNNRARTHAARRGNSGLQRHSSLSAIDIFRRKPLVSDECQNLEKKISHKIKSVRFCLSDGNSPNESFEEENYGSKPNSSSLNSFENESLQNGDDVFVENNSENASVRKDEENYRIKQVSWTSQKKYLNNSTNDSTDNDHLQNYISEENNREKETTTKGYNGKISLVSSDANSSIADCNGSLNSSQQLNRSLMGASEDGLQIDNSRREKGVSRQVLYLLQKDFINSSCGSSRPKLTLKELEGVRTALSTSESQNGEDRHRNMIRMVETLISRQKALIQKQEREMERGDVVILNPQSAPPSPACPTKNSEETERKKDPSDHLKNNRLKDSLQSSASFITYVNDAGVIKEKEKHQQTCLPVSLLNGHGTGNGLHTTLVLKELLANENSIVKETKTVLERGETSEYNNGHPSAADSEEQKGYKVRHNYVDSQDQSVNAFDEISDEEIKEIIARGKKLLPKLNAAKRDTLSEYIISSGSSSSELSPWSGTGDQLIRNTHLSNKEYSKSDSSDTVSTVTSNESLNPLPWKKDSSTESCSNETNRYNVGQGGNACQADVAIHPAFETHLKKDDRSQSDVKFESRDDSVQVRKVDISNPTVHDETEAVSEISELSTSSHSETTKHSVSGSPLQIVQENSHQEKKFGNEKQSDPSNSSHNYSSGLHNDMISDSSVDKQTSQLKRDRNTSPSSAENNDQCLDVGSEGSDVCEASCHNYNKRVEQLRTVTHARQSACPGPITRVCQHHHVDGSSDETVENSSAESSIPWHCERRKYTRSQNQCQCSISSIKGNKPSKKDPTSLKAHECHRRDSKRRSSGNKLTERIAAQREFHCGHSDVVCEDSFVDIQKKNRTPALPKQSYCNHSSDSILTCKSERSHSCNSSLISPTSQHFSSSPDSSGLSPCHCTSTRKKPCRQCKSSQTVFRKQKDMVSSERQSPAVADANSAGDPDIGPSTWSDSSCQCSRCLAVSFRHSSVSQRAGEPPGSLDFFRSSRRINHGFAVESGRKYPPNDKWDTPIATSYRQHKLHPHRNGFRTDRHFQFKKYSQTVPDITQYVVYQSDSSEVFETQDTPDYDEVPNQRLSPVQDSQQVDAKVLKEILADFHELFLCLCRDRKDHQTKEGQKQEAIIDDIPVSQGEGNTTRSASEGMDSLDATYQQLDSEFDKVLADMKPHVLKLPHKSDRQKCAVWIKKLCEPPSPGITGRKNRNMYGQLMLQMLKRGVLEGPFDKKPADGPLPTLPPYMSIYFDEPMTGRDGQEEEGDKIPDWVNGELVESVGSSLYRKSTLGNPAATSTWLSGSTSAHEIRERPYSSLGVSLDKDPSISAPSRRNYLDSGDRGAVGGSILNDMDWTKPYNSSTFTSSLPKGTTFQDDTSIGRGGEREIELRTKMIEAKYHEEKLRLQQKHDAAVQKILDRKNAEIEDVKNHYRGKIKDLEDTNAKLERKIQSLLKDMSLTRDSKDKQIADLKKLVEDTSDSRKSEYDKKMHEVTADFEQEKFEMQKQHTRNIQEILDDTNARLQRMEKEYMQQMTSNTNVIRELESRVQQLTSEAEQQLTLRSGLEREKIDLEDKCAQVSSELGDLTDRYQQLERESHQQQESHEHELRTIKHKTEASLEFLKQEHTLAASKASEAVKEMENQVDSMRRKMKESDDQCQKQIRDLETVHQQDKLHLENLHDKQIRSMKKEIDQMEQESQKKIRHLEHLLQEKDIEICRLKEHNREQALSAEHALEEFKAEVEKNQTRMYEEMKQQMTQVESDLNKSKQAREKQNRELTRQLQHERSKFDRQMAEMKVSFEHEKAQMLHDLHLQKEYILSEHEKAVDTLKEGHKVELRSLEARYRERQDKDTKNATEFESQVRELREELVQSNQLRKQQLVELGLLREEEKQKMMRDHEAEVSRLRSDMEQQRLELQKTHSGEMEAMLEKTNQRLKDIEKEYAARGQKSNEVVAEFQSSTNQLREEIKRIREQSDHRIAELVTQQEEDKKAVKKQYSTNVMALQKELDSQRSKCRHLERQLQRQDADQEEKVTKLKLGYEERMRGLMPAAVRQELEDTIKSLKSQVNSLQQRAAVLQDELDLKIKNPLGSFGTLTSSPIIKSSV